MAPTIGDVIALRSHGLEGVIEELDGARGVRVQIDGPTGKQEMTKTYSVGLRRLTALSPDA